MTIAVLIATDPAFAQLDPASTPGGALPRLAPPPAPPPPADPEETPGVEAAEPERADPEVARIPVKAFRIEGVIDRPEYNIRREHVEALAAGMIEEYPNGFGIREFRRLTSAITGYYRQAGLFLARAYIPEQTVDDNVVEIRVIEGILGEVQPRNNTLYPSSRLQAPFERWIGQPVHDASIEREILILNELPGFEAAGIFRPGQTLGTTSLLLDVRRDEAVDVLLSADNYGTDLTGEYRGILELHWNNTTGAADQLRASVLQTLQPANNFYGSIAYTRPVYRPGYEMEVGYTTNAFTVGQLLSELDIEGESSILNASLRREFIHRRDERLFATADLSLKSATSSQAGTDIGSDDLTVLSASGQYEFQDRRFRGGNLVRAGLAIGLPELLGSMDDNGDGVSSRTGASGDRAGGNFTKLTLNYSRLQALPRIPMFRNQNLLFRLQMQFSSDLLTSLEQMPLGGPNSVRAYPPSEVLADTATLISAEWQARTAPGSTGGMFKNLRVTAFFDYASGQINDALPNEEDSVTLAGTGFGLLFTPRPRLEAKVEMATAMGSREPSSGGGLQTFFRLDYTF